MWLGDFRMHQATTSASNATMLLVLGNKVKEGIEHWRKRQQDGFSKLSQMFEQLEDSYNHFSLALLHLDVNRLWKVLCAPFKVYRIFTILLQFVLMT